MAMFTVPIIWVLGAPGSGKSTLCHKIEEKYGFVYLSRFQVLRKEFSSGTDLGRELEASVKAGEVVSSRTILSLLKQAIHLGGGHPMGFVIDGFPQERQDGLDFESEIAPADLIIYLDCKEDVLLKRGVRHTTHLVDKDPYYTDEELFKTRLRAFNAKKQPILTLYKDTMLTLRGDNSLHELHEEVSRVVDLIMQEKTKATLMRFARRESHNLRSLSLNLFEKYSNK